MLITTLASKKIFVYDISADIVNTYIISDKIQREVFYCVMIFY